jgi:hypothetical protein
MDDAMDEMDKMTMQRAAGTGVAPEAQGAAPPAAALPEDTEGLWNEYKNEFGRDGLPDVPEALVHLGAFRLGGDCVTTCLEALRAVEAEDLPAGLRDFLVEMFSEVRQLALVALRLSRQTERLLRAQIAAEIRAGRGRA